MIVEPETPNARDSSAQAEEDVKQDPNETILSTDPFKTRFTFTIDDDALSLTVDDELSVIDATTSSIPESA